MLQKIFNFQGAKFRLIFGALRSWRVLVIIQVASLRSPITSTRHYETETRKKRWDSMPDGRAFALTRLRIGPFIRSAAISRIPIPSFLLLVVLQFALRSWRIACLFYWNHEAFIALILLEKRLFEFVLKTCLLMHCLTIASP